MTEERRPPLNEPNYPGLVPSGIRVHRMDLLRREAHQLGELEREHDMKPLPRKSIVPMVMYRTANLLASLHRDWPGFTPSAEEMTELQQIYTNARRNANR